MVRPSQLLENQPTQKVEEDLKYLFPIDLKSDQTRVSQQEFNQKRSLIELIQTSSISLDHLKLLNDNIKDQGPNRGLDLINSSPKDNLFLHSALIESKNELRTLIKSGIKKNGVILCLDLLDDMLNCMDNIKLIYSEYQKDLGEIQKLYTGRRQAMSEIAAKERLNEALNNNQILFNENCNKLKTQLPETIRYCESEINSSKKSLLIK